MAQLAIYPTLPGLTFSVIKRPKWFTGIAQTASGREARVGYANASLWEWDLTYDYLPDQRTASSGTDSDLQTLIAFYQARSGAMHGFLFKDPDDHAITGQVIGQADGTTTDFTLYRQLGHDTIVLDSDAPLEPIGYVDATQPFNVYLNDVLVAPSSYGLALTTPVSQKVHFHAAPASGVAISVDMTFFYYVRFKDDIYEFEKFYDRLWSQRLLTLASLRGF